MNFVLDASVAVALFYLEEQHRTDATRIIALAVGRATIPQTFELEVMNLLVKAERRRRGQDGKLERQLVELGRFGLTTDDQTLDRVLAHSLPLARKYRLSLFDATYLELAIRLGAPLATLDAGLTRAATAASIPLI